MAEIIRVEERGVGYVTIANPAKANAITEHMKTGLEAAWAWVESTPSIRVAVITGVGERHFCAGADTNRLASQARAGRSPTASTRFAPHMYGVTKPVVAAVNGAVVGAAIGLVADADIVIASANTYFMDSHVDLGLISAYGALRMATRISPTEVSRLVLGGRTVRLSAERAHVLGFVNEVVRSPADARTRAASLAETIAGAPRWAVETSLRFLRAMTGSSGPVLDEAMALTHGEWARPEAREGTAAWAESRPPEWRDG